VAAKSPYRGAGDITVEWYPPSYPARAHHLHSHAGRAEAGAKGREAAKPITRYDPSRPSPSGEIRLVGCEDLIVSGLTAKTKQPVPTLYQAAAQRVDRVRNAMNPMIMVGANRADNPADVWAGGPGYHQLAGFEVSAFDAVPQDMTVALYAPSRYAVFTCDAPTDPAGKLLGRAGGAIYPTTLNRRWVQDKSYYLGSSTAEVNGDASRAYELWFGR
jgi:predicted transcriptional regulator YdeE